MVWDEAYLVSHQPGARGYAREGSTSWRKFGVHTIVTSSNAGTVRAMAVIVSAFRERAVHTQHIQAVALTSLSMVKHAIQLRCA
jgi:hypothetical protein